MRTQIVLVTSRLWLALAAFIFLAVSAAAPAAHAAGHWRYVRMEVTPTDAELNRPAASMPGRVYEAHASGGFQAAFSGQGSVEMTFRADDVDRRVYESRLLFTFSGSAPMQYLTPGDTIRLQGTLMVTSNFPGAAATGTVSVDNGDYLINTEARAGRNGNGQGSFRVPSGATGTPMIIHAGGYISSYGGLRAVMNIYYEWVEGPAPARTGGGGSQPLPSPTPPAFTPPGEGFGGGFSGGWRTSEGDMSLSQNGARVSGTYTQDNGRIDGEVRGNRLSGFWSEGSSNQRCSTQRLGSFYWGRIEWTLSPDGRRFEGSVSYCDGQPYSSWTGDRTSGPAPYSSGGRGAQSGSAPSSGSGRTTQSGRDSLQGALGALLGIPVPDSTRQPYTAPPPYYPPSSGPPTSSGSAAGGFSTYAAPSPGGKVFDNWNTSGCGSTDTAILDVNRPMQLDRIQLWFNWRANERTVNYRVYFQGREIGGGTLRRGDCDPYQAAWCAADDSPASSLAPGRYTFRLDRAALCQNSGSGGAGFIRAWGSFL